MKNKKDKSPYPVPEPISGYKPDWRNIFNTSHKMWFDFNVAHKAALDAGYGYFSWNEWIYYTNTGRRTTILVEDI